MITSGSDVAFALSFASIQTNPNVKRLLSFCPGFRHQGEAARGAGNAGRETEAATRGMCQEYTKYTGSRLQRAWLQRIPCSNEQISLRQNH